MSNGQSLPHWASLALAVTCARAVVPTLWERWLESAPESQRLVARTIAWAESSARTGASEPSGAALDREMTELAGRLLLAAQGIRLGGETPSDLPSDQAIAKEVSDMLTVVAKTTETARARPSDSGRIADEAYNWALEALRDDAAARRQLEAERLSLYNASSKGRWTDTTAVERVGDRWVGKDRSSWQRLIRLAASPLRRLFDSRPREGRDD